MSRTFHGAGLAPRVEAVLIIALYQPESGRIAHMHTVTQLVGGRTVDQDEAIHAAREHAERIGHPVTELRVAVTSDPGHAVGPHRIDPQTGAFVRLPESD